MNFVLARNRRFFITGRKLFVAIMLSIALVTAVFSAEHVNAAEINGSLNFNTNYAASGDGYDWDNASKTLTLNGFSLNADGTALSLPQDATIILQDKSENSITSNSDDGIYTPGGLTIKGDGTLNIKAAKNGIAESVSQEEDSCLKIEAGENGIYTLNSMTPVEIKDNAALEITASQSGIKTAVFLGVEISGSPKIKINAGEDGICSGDKLTVTGASLDITAGNNGLYADWDTLQIVDCEKLKINSKGNGVAAAESALVKNTPLDITSAGCGICAEQELVLERIDAGLFYPGESGEALNAHKIVIDSANLTVDGGAKGISCTSSGSVEIKNNSKTDINSKAFGDLSKLVINEGCTVNLDKNTVAELRGSDVWTIDGILITNGSLINNGSINGNGALENNGTFTQETSGSFGFGGNLSSGKDALVYVSGDDKDLKEKLKGLGKVLEIIQAPLDFTSGNLPPNGDTYSWDAETKTLILDGFVMCISDLKEGEAAIKLPEDAKIKLMPGTKNGIKVAGGNGKAVRAEGDLLIYGGGALKVNHKALAIDTGSNLDIVDSAVTVSSAIGIAAQKLNVSFAQLLVLADTGSTVVVTEGMKSTGSDLGLYSFHDTVISLVNETADLNDLSLEGQPDGIKAVRQDNGSIVLINSESGEAVQTLEIAAYRPGHVVFFQTNSEYADFYKAVEHNKCVESPKIKKDGYKLAGWYSASDFKGGSYDFDMPIISDMTLYAKWEKNVPGSSPNEEQNSDAAGAKDVPGEGQASERADSVASTGDDFNWEFFVLVMIAACGAAFVSRKRNGRSR